MHNSREQFLGSWIPYPVVDSGDLEKATVGRVVSFDEDFLVLSSAGQNITYSIGLGSQMNWLQPGDWVKLQLSGETTVVGLELLAPNLKTDFPVSEKMQTHLLWVQFLDRARQYLLGMGSQEVQTPGLVICPGLEPHLSPFATDWQGQSLYLPTSPEIHLKKMLCLGYQRVFEIKKVYRNELGSPMHRPEFTMLEWYLSFASLRELAGQLKEFVQALAGEGLTWRWKKVTVSELFKSCLGFELTPETSASELLDLCELKRMRVRKTDSFDELFQVLWVEFIEERLGELSPHLLIFDFPPSQAALSRINEAGWADRFELYWHGVECANAYQELNDPNEQLERFRQFQQQRTDSVPIDEDFMESMKSGMPPAAGVAIGLERLFMALNQISDINGLYEF